ncbi:MAG: Geranylgeranylglyceryl phosphate synthase [bacterium]|nr:Geranylgeranylglyceryl phosphate synthase [bacterium]MCK6562602.1 geranylgeranylglyceryl/heptaprenylglyceryl phosphate synthase [bacterium]NUM66429.1 geranylgeranylglyceryl/heptaprenylglyceryl phosphate synthase [candidate division KSB1 bacterium]
MGSGSATVAHRPATARDGVWRQREGPHKVYDYLLSVRAQSGAGHFVLIDPDKWEFTQLAGMAAAASEGGADAILIGSSMLLNPHFDDIVLAIRAATEIPCLLFPGSTIQLSRHADAVLFLSLISGRNANYLIGEQVKAAPLIRHFGIESIATGYMLIDSGRMTSAEYMSNTRPMPRDKHDIAKATALAAQYLGMQWVYLEAGSGAEHAISPEMIAAVAGYVEVPVIAGGGIRTPEQAAKCVAAGAAFVVTGNVFEQAGGGALIRDFAAAIHAGSPPAP